MFTIFFIYVNTQFSNSLDFDVKNITNTIEKGDFAIQPDKYLILFNLIFGFIILIFQLILSFLEYSQLTIEYIMLNMRFLYFIIQFILLYKQHKYFICLWLILLCVIFFIINIIHMHNIPENESDHTKKLSDKIKKNNHIKRYTSQGKLLLLWVKKDPWVNIFCVIFLLLLEILYNIIYILIDNGIVAMDTILFDLIDIIIYFFGIVFILILFI